MEKLIYSAFREGYGVDQINRTMTAGELINFLAQYDEDRVSSFFSMYPQPAALAIRRRFEPSSTQGASWRQVLLPNKMSSAPDQERRPA